MKPVSPNGLPTAGGGGGGGGGGVAAVPPVKIIKLLTFIAENIICI